MATPAKMAEALESFLKNFKDKVGKLKYRDRLSQTVSANSKSLTIDFEDLLVQNVDMANRLRNNPDELLLNKPDEISAFNKAAYETLRIINPNYAEKIRKDIQVRIRNLTDSVSLRGITTEHLDKLVSVNGMVVRASELKPLAVEASFKCTNGHVTKVTQSGMVLKKPQRCDEASCKSVKFELDMKNTVFVDYQVIRLQEPPEELPPGQLPQAFDVSMQGDIVNTARPGDRVILTGIVRAEAEYSQIVGKLRLFRSRIEGNYVEVLGKEPELIQITKEDEELIHSITSQPEAYEKLIESVAPAIHGCETQKEAILLLVTGSPQRVMPDGTTIRGDMNVLLVGDPGTAKSELLKYTARIAPRGLYTSGRGSTAAGLTAAVVREKTGMMMLEAGAVVLADQGVAAIDEFDKMRPEDRNALHEVMEQQTASVAKGGIVATLNARASILAASNPVLGKYDPYRNIADNLNLPIPLLTRFDLIFVMRDMPDRTRDEQLARHVLELHRKGEYVRAPPIDSNLLRKYIVYAKRIQPILTKEAEEKLLEYYLEMRKAGSEFMITVTPRQLESMIRLATARTRIMLRDKVTEEDAIRAISLMRRMLETVGVDVKTGKMDLGVLHGKPLSERTLLETALDIFKTLEGPQKNPVEGRTFVDELVKTGKFNQDDAQRMLQTLNRSGQIYEIKPGFYRKL
ncbi:MAG: minichromosome maintenance protein MCM [Nitrososphaerales archaeon]|nr:minichromosome maintenance protein MCM [Nitrososphaerales archaeon]